MAKLNTIVNFLNKELKIKSIKDDWSVNGLQVKASNEVTRVGLATDACMDVFENAKILGCDLIIVHHGMLIPKQKLSKRVKRSMSFLKKNRISLYAAHLPLDKHMKYGNNSSILRLLELESNEVFAKVGYITNLKKSRSIDSIAREIENKLDTKCIVWKFGKTKIKRLAMISGNGSGEIDKAAEKCVDLFITGETSHGSYLRAKDNKLSVIMAGHYKTETVGVKEVGKLLEKKFNVKIVFIDNPTGM